MTFHCGQSLNDDVDGLCGWVDGSAVVDRMSSLLLKERACRLREIRGGGCTLESEEVVTKSGRNQMEARACRGAACGLA